MILLVYAPCIENPLISYKGPLSENLELTKYLIKKFSELKLKYYNKVIFVPYPCPEFLLTLKSPRVPASKEMYEMLGMKNIAKFISKWIGKIVEEIKPDNLIIVGMKYSPTCGVNGTYRLKDKSKLEEFLEYLKRQEIDKSKILKEDMVKVEGEAGVLMEVLKEEFPYAKFIDFSIKSILEIDEGIDRLEKLIKTLL